MANIYKWTQSNTGLQQKIPENDMALKDELTLVSHTQCERQGDHLEYFIFKGVEMQFG